MRATSLSRTREPSGLERTTISPNWSAVISLPGGIHVVLLLNGFGDVGNGKAEFSQNVGLDPDTHGVIARAEDSHFAHARNAVQRVIDIDVRVVGQEQ